MKVNINKLKVNINKLKRDEWDKFFKSYNLEDEFRKYIQSEKQQVAKDILEEISEMNNTDEDVWTGYEVKEHLIKFIESKYIN